MRFSTVFALATGLVAVSAVPNHHRHGHLHAKKTAEARSPSFYKTTRPENVAPETLEKTVETEDSVPSYSSEDKPSGGKKAFCAGAEKRATYEQITYKGNTGVPGHWGCNIMEVDCGTLELYDYGATFTGNGSDFSCVAFNKIGPDGKNDGQWYSALEFTLSGSEKVCIAFDADSQGSISCDDGLNGVRKVAIGQWGGSWYEFDYGSKSNGGQSGCDVSVLVAMPELSFPGMKCSSPIENDCSTLTSYGEHHQAYLPGMEALDGVGCVGYAKGVVKVELGDY